MAKQVIMYRIEKRTAETEPEGFGATGYGDLHDKLRARYDDALRGFPDMSPEEAFAYAWRGLSLSERNQIRAEESGEAQQREAEEARLRASATRKGINMQSGGKIGILTRALHGVYADEDLTKREREEILGEVLDDYRVRTGRDGLADIAGYSAPQASPETMKSADRQEMALAYLEGKAEQLRKANPKLSKEQAFARAYADAANRDVARIERSASEATFAAQAAAQHGDGMRKRVLVATRDGAVDEIWKRADELRRSDLSLTREQAFAKAYTDPSNRDLARAERQAAMDAIA
jgi:hypothetical protein